MSVFPKTRAAAGYIAGTGQLDAVARRPRRSWRRLRQLMNCQAAEVISSIICRGRSSAGADKVESHLVIAP